MKKIFFLILPLAGCLAAISQVVPTTATTPASISSGINPVPAGYYSNLKVNLVRSWTAMRPYTSESDVTNSSRQPYEVAQVTQYFDGLGRPLQTVAKKATPQGRDLVSMNLYDEFGREGLSYMPYMPKDSNYSNGLFKRNPFAEQAAFYASSTYNPGMAGEQVYYARTSFEASPLNRPTASYAPGNSWGGSNVGTGIAHAFNAAADSVRIWNIGSTIGATPTSSGCYAAGQLYKTTTTDEHGKQVAEYKDKEGRVVLKKVQLDNSPSSHHTGWLCTYYVYDDFGLLRFVMQPKAVEEIAGPGLWAISNAIRDGLCFWYAYDGRNRMVVKKVPGAGEVHMVYDQRDRLVMVQDANMLVNEQWLVTAYDNLNRPLKTYLMESSEGREYHEAEAGDVYPDPDWLDLNADLLTETYYDSYSWVSGSGSGLGSTLNTGYAGYMPYGSSNSSYPYAQAVTADYATEGMATGTKTRVLGTGNFLYTVSFYDSRGRALQSQSTNITGGKDIVTNQYSFSGQVLASVHDHTNNAAGQQYCTLTMNTYDANGRSSTTTKQVGRDLDRMVAAPAVQVSGSSYDALGRLQDKQLGHKRDADNGGYLSGEPLETLTYRYNVRGWLTSINRAYARDGGTDHWFGMELSYDIGFSQAQLNGNIAGTRWRARGSDEQRAYGFAYDAANRLLKGDFTQYTGSAWNTSGGVDFSMKMGDGSSAASAYDANGNILKMWQRGLKVSSSATIDSLTYAYAAHGNQLLRVTDGVTADNKLGDFKDGSNGSDDYAYDANGNLGLDSNKDIESISYNHLNLPATITVTGKGTISYAYDAAGSKLGKVITEGSRVTTTTYAGGLVYRNDTLQYMPHEEGRVRRRALTPAEETIISGGGDVENEFIYEYYIKDHLGNVRTVLTDELKTDVYHASLEDENMETEGLLFSNLAGITEKPDCFDSEGDNKLVQKVEAKGDSDPMVIGQGIVLKVMAGDRVNAHVLGSYDNTAGGNDPYTTTPLEQLIAALFSSGISATGTHGGSPLGSGGGSLLLPGITDFLNTVPDNYAPNGAYLNWVLLDGEQFKMVEGNSGFEGLTGEGSGGDCTPAALLQMNGGDGMEVTKNGYLYVFVSNTSDQYPVYFDQLHVEHVRGPLVEETQYYPFGLTMGGISSKAAMNAPSNKLKYNGKEEQRHEFSDGSGLEWLDFEARSYDAQIARFTTIDPLKDKFEKQSPYAGMNNNPILFNDPTGMGGEVTIDKDGTIRVSAIIYVYSSVLDQASVGKYANKIKKDIESQWNHPVSNDGTPTENAGQYNNLRKLVFEVSVIAVTPEEAANKAENNTNIAVNFMAIVDENAKFDHGVPASFVKENTNSGYFYTKNLDERGSTSAAHEFGHLLGYLNKDNKSYGKDDVLHANSDTESDFIMARPLGGEALSKRRVHFGEVERLNGGKGFKYDSTNFKNPDMQKVYNRDTKVNHLYNHIY